MGVVVGVAYRIPPPSQMTPGSSGQWDETPGRAKGSETPGATPSTRQWDATPGHATPGHATPSTPGKRNRWDETPRWGETPRADRGEDLFTLYMYVCNVVAYMYVRMYVCTQPYA